MKLKISNDCHSYSRFKCYKNDIQFLQMLKEIEDELKMGHRYYNSVDCAKKVFNDINNIWRPIIWTYFKGISIYNSWFYIYFFI